MLRTEKEPHVGQWCDCKETMTHARNSCMLSAKNLVKPFVPLGSLLTSEFRVHLESMTVPELKKLLKADQLPTEGKKAELGTRTLKSSCATTCKSSCENHSCR